MDAVELPVITGPTAAGKSAIALRLAERVGASIVSADSRQIYRGFDIGTAKPTAGERERVPHHGIDVVDARDRYSAARWAEDAARWIDADRAAGRASIVVGGTGFYLRALFTPLFAEPAMDPGARRDLQRYLAALDTDELRRWSAMLDPRRVDVGRAQQLRTIEVALLTGARLSDLHDAPARPARFRPRYLVVDPGGVLRDRIAGRVDAMIDRGWPDEVRSLITVVPEDAPAWNAAGYEVIRQMIRGAITSVAARERVIIETRQYAKRQRTWLRHQLGDASVVHVDPGAPDANDVVEQWWSGETA